jgi:hypothetical protein
MLGYIPLLNGYCHKTKNTCIAIHYRGKRLSNIDIFTAVSAFEIDGLSRSILVKLLSKKRRKHEFTTVLHIYIQDRSTRKDPRLFLMELTKLQAKLYLEKQIFTADANTNPDN